MRVLVWKLFLGDFGIVGEVDSKTDAIKDFGYVGYAESNIGRADSVRTHVGHRPSILGEQKVRDQVIIMKFLPDMRSSKTNIMKVANISKE